MLTLFVTLIIMKIFKIQLQVQRTYSLAMGSVKLVIAAMFILYSFQGAAQQGTVKSYQKVSDTQGNMTGLSKQDNFGTSVTSIGDFDGDGNNDIMVGAPMDGDGAVYVIMLDNAGQVLSTIKISDDQSSLNGILKAGDEFGSSCISLGDIDGDGNPDFAIGAPGNDKDDKGAVYVVKFNSANGIKSVQKISEKKGNLSGKLMANDNFGSSLALLDDYDGDGG